MPILNSVSGKTTQCDIVIRDGTPPRQNITLIEVQDRESRVKPNDFRGWVGKLNDVGAHRLICVSKQEFPKSIKESASRLGGRICLMTLKESTADTIPLVLLQSEFNFNKLEIETVESIRINPVISEKDITSEELRQKLLANSNMGLSDQCWSLDGQNLESLNTLVTRIFSHPAGSTSGTGKLEFNHKEDPPLYYVLDGLLIRTGLIFEFNWTLEITNIPVTMLTYEANEHGAMAWVAEIEYNSPAGRKSVV